MLLLKCYITFYGLGTIASFVGVGFVFAYSLMALVDEYNAGPRTVVVNETLVNGSYVESTTVLPSCSSAVKNWVIFLCVWSGISLYELITKNAEQEKDDLWKKCISSVIMAIMSLGFFLGSYFEYWQQPTCEHTDMNNAVYVFMVYELAVFGFNSLLVLCGWWLFSREADEEDEDNVDDVI